MINCCKKLQNALISVTKFLDSYLVLLTLRPMLNNVLEECAETCTPPNPVYCVPKSQTTWLIYGLIHVQDLSVRK
ncbi:hypothetical protein VNO77_20265 [Canavalia gladiata]|uniref:Uncharacterized protein n=1 Tax=Canavalia gladiata TaxID=3824 RepID=A0AAN9QQD8_CANGL